MSEIKTINSIPIPIPIKYSKSWHSFSDPNNQIQKYLFELEITMNSDERKIFKNLESDKHSNLIITKDKIKLSEIKSFKIIVSKLPYNYSFNYHLEGLINHDNTSYTQQDENLFIEFSKNSNGFTLCNASFIGVDFEKLCITPPN